MVSVESIKAPIAREMVLFEDKFKEAIKGNAPLLDKITHYIVKRKGKQMRPMFIFLAANLCGGVSERSYRAANLIEMIHTATLVHDDIVDDANKRRGFFSVNALWKNKIAVLVGDFLLSKGLQLAAKHKDYDFLEIISEVTKEMSEGELLQIEKARRLDIKEDIYFKIIRQKTATLIAACCATGASSAGADKEEVEKLRLLGEKIGVAFQIKDDLFDYESSISLIGKPVGIDIKERKMTLPLIYALNNATRKEKRWMINVVKNHNENQKKVTELIQKVKASGGIEYTKKKMYEIREEAMDIIKTYPETPSRQSLIDLILYTTEREK
jgi:octaprenyl-diphosphate synthase